MTEKDLEIQRLARRVANLEEMVNVIVEAYKVCRYCKYADADCSPTGSECKPEVNFNWR